MKLVHFLLVFQLLIALPSAAVGAAAKPGSDTAAKAASAPTVTRRIPLTWLGSKPVLVLRTTDDTTVNFGSRADELITRAVLHLRYVYSPALLAPQSHLKLLLNDEVVAVLPLAKDGAGRQQSADIEIDPRLIVDANRLTFNFVGHYSNEWEDQSSSSLWANVSGTSELELSSHALPVNAELSLLPAPFLDRRDQRRLLLPFVFGARPARGTLLAAGVTASWFGQLAAWRGARFPVQLDRLPGGHAVVFATNTEFPAFLDKKLAPITGPTLAIMTNPGDGISKLLLVLGRDGKDLKAAADALALGSAALSGVSAVLKDARPGPPRQAYDAPNWVRMDRPTTLGELIEYPQQLQSSGYVPEPIHLKLRIPPDLFIWPSAGIPLALKFRHTPPAASGESRLDIAVNAQLLKVLPLRPSGLSDESLHLPLLDAELQTGAGQLHIPAYQLGARSELQFAFRFAAPKVGRARDTQADQLHGAVDADSTLDFSSHLHYAELPNLGHFAALGFPFTKYADLSQTVVVLPLVPAAQDIEAMLALLGHMGEATGYPATGLTVAGPDDDVEMRNADLLLIGVAPQQALLGRWREHLPATIDGPLRAVNQPRRAGQAFFDWLAGNAGADAVATSWQQFDSSAPLAALLAFESPLSAHRSVVALTAVSPEDMAQVLDALDDPAAARNMHGSVVLVRGAKVDSVMVGPTYVVGTLPFVTELWLRAARHPLLMAALAVLMVLIVAFGYWRWLRGRAARRMRSAR